MMSTLEDICLCEFGFRLGDGRTDSNKCPVHDMSHAELLEYAANGWGEAIRLEAQLALLRRAKEGALGIILPALAVATMPGYAYPGFTSLLRGIDAALNGQEAFPP